MVLRRLINSVAGTRNLQGYTIQSWIYSSELEGDNPTQKKKDILLQLKRHLVIPLELRGVYPALNGITRLQASRFQFDKDEPQSTPRFASDPLSIVLAVLVRGDHQMPLDFVQFFVDQEDILFFLSLVIPLELRGGYPALNGITGVLCGDISSPLGVQCDFC
jgi:hypothetical protein